MKIEGLLLIVALMICGCGGDSVEPGAASESAESTEIEAPAEIEMEQEAAP